MRLQWSRPLGTGRVPASCWRDHRVCGSLEARPSCMCVPTARPGQSWPGACWQNGLYQQLERGCGLEVFYVKVPAMGETGIRGPATGQTEHLSPAIGETHLACMSVPPADLCPAQYKPPTSAHHLVLLLHWSFELIMVKSSYLFRALME